MEIKVCTNFSIGSTADLIIFLKAIHSRIICRRIKKGMRKGMRKNIFGMEFESWEKVTAT